MFMLQMERPADDTDNNAGDFEMIAGALVTAVRRSVQESMNRRFSEARDRLSGTTHSAQQQGSSTEDNRRSTEQISSSGSTAYERAIMLQSTMRRDLGRQATPTRRMLPSAFKPAKRGRRGASLGEQSPASHEKYQYIN